jgi:signal transduction histidine kinase
MRMEFEAQEIFDRLAPYSGIAMANTYNLGWGFYDMYNAWPEVPESYSSYSKNQLLASSENYFQKTLAVALRMNNKQWEMFAKGILGDVHFEKKEFEKAYILSSQHSKLRDSLFSQSNKNKIAALENQKAILEKDQEIEIKELKIAQREKEKWYFIGGLVLLALIGGLLWHQNRVRRQRNNDLRQLNTALSEANSVKAKLFSILNHDLRSPVANLINFINLQKNNPDLLDANTRARLENKTLVSAQNLLVSMEDLLIWCKNQMDHFEPKFAPCKVGEIFNEIKRYFANYEGVIISFDYLEVDVIHTDINYLNTILRNLTLNALHATKHETHPKIEWKCRINDHKVHLTISDNGPGFEKEISVFEQQQVEIKSITQGLGIQIIKDLISAIKGSIHLDKTVEKGCTIHVQLPVQTSSS